MPDIPHDEHPERNELKVAAERVVTEKLRALDIGLDLERHPEVRERLAELGSHFDDSVDIARIIRATFEELCSKLDLSAEAPERIMRAAVLHDIGKSGPAGERGEFHFAVRRLFIPPSGKFNFYAADGRPKTIADFMVEQGMKDADRITAALKEQNIDATSEAIIFFWRRHAGWTYDILRGDLGPDIDDDLVKIAASHHLLEGQNPATLDIARPQKNDAEYDIIEFGELLGAIDKYQAMRVRGGHSHESAIAKLRATVESSPNHPERLKAEYRTAFNVLDRNKDSIGKLLTRAKTA